MVPLFYFTGSPINVAVGTSKFIIVFISVTSSVVYSRARKVDLRMGSLFMATMIPGSYLGAYLVPVVDPDILRIFIGLFILAYSIRLIYRYIKTRNSRVEGSSEAHRVELTPVKWVLAGLIGLATGLVAGLTGTGGGAILVPAMTMLLGVPIHEAVATSMYSMLLAAITAAFRHHLNGDIDYGIAPLFLVGAVLGAIVGPRISLRLKPQNLRLVVAVVLGVVAVRMLL